MRKIILLLVLAISSAAFAQEFISDAWNLNSPANEEAPFLINQGRTILFTRGHHPENIGGKADKGDIWISSFTDEEGWTTPEQLPAPINTAYYNGGFAYLNNRLFVYGNYRNNTPSIPGISVSNVVSWPDEWSSPANLKVKYFTNASANNGNCLSEDGKIMILAVETFKTLGAEDLYVSFWDGEKNEWSELKNLGNQINTPLQELTPFLSKDNKTLFFSSNGRGGVGSRDIFVSQRLDDSWTNWSEPRNLGEGINTDGAEMGYRYYPDYELAVYTSTKDSDGYGDILIVPVTADEINQLLTEDIFIPMDDSDIVVSNNDRAIEAGENTLLLHGIITELTTNNKVFARSKVIGRNGFEQEHYNDTTFSFTIMSGQDYSLQIEADGYFSKQIDLVIKTNKAKEIVKNVQLERIVIGARVKLDNVLFVRGETEFLEISYKELDLIVEMMSNNPTMVIELAGHTDNVGNPNLNQRLSQERVDAVINYLVEEGIDSSRLSGKGHGGSQPLASNASESTRRKNRRVEFIVIEQ